MAATNDHRPSEQQARGGNHGSLNWYSVEVQSVFEKYWSSDPVYLMAKANSCKTKSWSADPKCKELFEKLGYLEGPITDMEEFILGGEVHPVFLKANFITDPELPEMDQVHDAMTPAKRLATEFILSEHFNSWWLHVRHGRCSETSPVFLESGPLENSPSAKDLFAKEFLEFAENVKFTWFAENSTQDSSGPMRDCTGVTIHNIPIFFYVMGDEDVEEKYDEETLQTPNPIIGLSLNFYYRLLASKHMTPGENMRLQYTLAQLLLHELAHAFGMYWQGVNEEVRAYESDVFGEMGFSLEKSLFGCIIRCEGLDYHPKNCIGPMVAIRLEDLYPVVHPAIAFVPMTWIRQWFRLETWANIPKLQALGKLQVPTTNGFPQVFRVDRYDSCVGLNRCIEYNLENEATLAISTEQRATIETQAAHEAKEYGSVAEWYKIVWTKEAEQVFKAGKLPESYYKPTHSYAAHFPDYVAPEWANVTERPSFKRSVTNHFRKVLDFVMREQRLPKV